jgi:hypothetical protein
VLDHCWNPHGFKQMRMKVISLADKNCSANIKIRKWDSVHVSELNAGGAAGAKEASRPVCVSGKTLERANEHGAAENEKLIAVICRTCPFILEQPNWLLSSMPARRPASGGRVAEAQLPFILALQAVGPDLRIMICCRVQCSRSC